MKRAAWVACWLLLGSVAHAFPDQALTLVTPYPPTGSPDIEGTSRITRLVRTMHSFASPPLSDSLAQELAHLLAVVLNQPVNLERRAQANTMAAVRHVASARADGYTLLFTGSPTITIYPALYADFNPRNGLEPVAMVARMPVVLVTAAMNRAVSVPDVMTRLRRVPEQVDFAVTGGGSTAQLAAMLFRIMSGSGVVHVNYNGSGSAINAVTARAVEFGFVPLTAALPYANSGALRIIAIASAARHPAVPAVSTIAESGLRGFEADGWFGVYAPRGIPDSVVGLLNHAFNQVLSEDHMRRTLIGRGLLAEPGTPARLRALADHDAERWGRLLKTPAPER